MSHSFEEVISLANLNAAWREFLVDKRRKPDVQLFERHLADNVVQLAEELRTKTYQPQGYYTFTIADPKPRVIHKAPVRDRLVHHAVHRILYPVFDRTFIADSFSCRLGKGTHKALERFETFSRRVSRNNTRTCWVLKMDIRKFFASIDHAILLEVLDEPIHDPDVLWLLEQIIRSHSSGIGGVGLPLGNLTSQLLVNIYMNVFDQFTKHVLKAKYYLRYADDFVILSPDREELRALLPRIEKFLWDRLRLRLHPKKVMLQTLASGVDYLGWVNFPSHRVLRKTTKKRMLNRLRASPTEQVFQSYLGLLGHGDTHKLEDRLKNDYWLWYEE